MLRLGFLQNEPQEKLKERWHDFHYKISNIFFMGNDGPEIMERYYKEYGYSRIHELETLVGVFEKTDEDFFKRGRCDEFIAVARPFHESDHLWSLLSRYKGDKSELYSSIVPLESVENVEDYLYAKELSGMSKAIDFYGFASNLSYPEYLRSLDSRFHGEEFSEVMHSYFSRPTPDNLPASPSFRLRVTETSVAAYLTLVHGKSKMMEFMKEAIVEGYRGRTKEIHDIVTHWQTVSGMPLHMAQFVAEDLAPQNDATELNLGDYDSPWKALL